MIRKSALILLIAMVFTACASGKVDKKRQTFEPAQFIVTDITVDIEAEPRPDRKFIRLTRSAAENLRQAYNREIVNSAGSYTVELSVKNVKVTNVGGLLEPISSNSITLLATLRHPDSGIALREVPITYQLVAESQNATKEEQLLRGALPAAFNGLYGIGATPLTVRPVVSSNQIFIGLDPEPAAVSQTSRRISQPATQPRPAPASTPTSDVSTSETTSGEPTVIECAIC